MPKTWFVTGAARGIGREITIAALNAGDQVVATARRPEQIVAPNHELAERLLAVELDVTDATTADCAVAAAVDRFGSIDVLVNNAGYGQMGHFETVSAAAIANQFETNVFGLMTVTRSVLPVMRRQGSGHVLNISSIGGALGFAGASIYCAAKFAVEGFSESIAHELTAFGIQVTIVEPGFFRTDFLDESSVQYGTIAIADYAKTETELQHQYGAYSHGQPGDPQRLAALISEVAGMPDAPARLLAGSDALAMSRELLSRRTDELERWAQRSSGTDFSEATAN